MALKYRFNLKDIKLEDFRLYLFSLFKAFIPKKKIKNIDDLEIFIQQKSAWVSQVTLYSYLKTRMGTKYVLHFDDEIFLTSINKAKWNIYAIALQDLTFYTLSYLNVFYNFKDMDHAKRIYEKILNDELKNKMPEDIIENGKEIFLKILDDETTNKMPLDIIEEAKKNFNERLQSIKWNTYYTDLPFNPSALSLYKWAPIAEE